MFEPDPRSFKEKHAYANLGESEYIGDPERLILNEAHQNAFSFFDTAETGTEVETGLADVFFRRA